MTTITKFKWFWVWNDEKEEQWLREMAQQGWYFKTISFPGNFEFEQGTPKDYVFRLDYFNNLAKEKDNYLQLFQDGGWDHMGEYYGWQYFRKEAVDGETPEIYSDNESKVNKYQRLLLYLVVFLPIYINLVNIVNRNQSGFMQILTFFMFTLMMLYMYAMLRLLLRIGQLKKKI